METLWLDVRQALRRARQSPLRTVTIIGSLALGIGSATAVYSAQHALRTLPAPGIPAAPDLVRLRGSVTSASSGQPMSRPLSHAEIMGYAGATQQLRSVGGWTDETALLRVAGGADALLATASFVTPGYFATLGLSAAAGRLLGAGDDDATAPAAVISHELWTGALGDRDVVGTTIQVDERLATVVGVAPRGFRGATLTDQPHVVWLPRAVRGPAGADSAAYQAIARLAPGVHRAGADAAMRVLARRLATAPPGDRFARPEVEVVPLLAFNDTPVAGTNGALATVASIALLLLVMTGANVAALFAGTGVARRQEMTVRLALGGSRARLLRQLLTESTLLSLAGALVGLLALQTGLHLFGTLAARHALPMDWRAVLAGTTVALLTGLASGLSPALAATRMSLSDTLKAAPSAGGSHRLGLQRRLITLQVAATQPLLLGIAVLVGVAAPGASAHRDEAAERIAVIEMNRIGASAGQRELQPQLAHLVERLGELPGARDVLSQARGFAVAAYQTLRDDGSRGAAGSVRTYRAAPGYFGVMGARLDRGREFARGDSAVAIVSASLARRLWGDADPIGRQLVRSAGGTETMLRVAGVVGDDALPPGAASAVWLPATAELGIWQTTWVRVDGNASALLPEIMRLARSAAPGLTLERVTTLAVQHAEARHSALVTSAIAAASGLCALLLASIGLYATSALAVQQRTREIGIRLALGASRGAVQRLIVGGGLRLTATGLVLGLPLSMLALRWVTRGALPLSNAMLGTLVAGLVVAVTLLAAWVPARRSANVDPTVAFRSD